MYYPEESVEETYMLAPMQQGMLFNRLLSAHSGVNIEQIVFELREDLEVSIFKEAWCRIIARHQIFRTSFHWEGLNMPLQTIHREVPFPFEHNDWRGLSSSEQTYRVQDCCRPSAAAVLIMKLPR